MPPKSKKTIEVNLSTLQWFTLQQAAEMLQLGVKTVQRRCEDGTIKAVRFGIKWRIPKSSMDKLAQTS